MVRCTSFSIYAIFCFGLPEYLCTIGKDLRVSKTSITRSLCNQIFTSPIHWTEATNFPKSATHALDFGPGGLSGIGPLTARNFDGRGVRVIVIGERGKGDAELYDSTTVQREDNWGEKYAPRLVQSRYVPFSFESPDFVHDCC